ncbi:MAG: D-alanine--D-alanine ligase [Candidatus Zambryskibacteria bacterium]|nr:D-alanine--D-alanine ligase [Candidatus Zambryskibacteria bacterium]
MAFSHKTRVGVLRGGPSPEYDVSLNTGRAVLSNLPEDCEPIDIFISKDGIWHVSGLERDPYTILKSLDMAINALHGTYGEDGTVQKMLDHFGIPYTGSDAMSSRLGMNKILTKKILSQAGLKTPMYMIVEMKEDGEIPTGAVNHINENLIFPIIIKPHNQGSSLGTSFVDKAFDIRRGLERAFEYSSRALVEEYISGKEVTCGVIDGFRDQDLYTTVPISVIPDKARKFHDYDSKYLDLGKYHLPYGLSPEEKEQIREATKLIHQTLGLRHYSRSDFIHHSRRGLFVLEVNTLPELSHRGAFMKALEAAGSNIKEFLSHLIKKTLKK